MDVIVVYPLIFQKGGADRVVLEIAKRFNAPIYTALYNRETAFREFADLDIRVIKQPIFEKPLFFLKKDPVVYGTAMAGMKFLAHRIREDYDVINAHGCPANWIRNRNERVCSYFYGPVRSAFDLYGYKVASLPLPKRLAKDAMFAWYKFWERRINPKIEKTVSVSPYVNERDAGFISEYIRKPVEPIPPGVDEKLFSNRGYGEYFLCQSRIIPEKRFEYAIDAFRIFSQRAESRKWKLVIAGSLPKRERELGYFESLKRLAHGLNVEFRADLEEGELRRLYSDAYALLYCPVSEDWGLPPLEGMASEKPCISVNEGGPRYSIVDGETGFLVNSPQEMAEKMFFLAEHADENERMGKEGRRHVLKNYTWNIFFDKMERAFKEVAGNSS